MKLFIITITCLLYLSNSVCAQNKIIIDGVLKNILNGTVISLMKQEGAVGTQVAKDSVINNHFHIEYTP